LSSFRRCEALGAGKIRIHANDRASRATSAGLTMRQRGGGFCIDPEPAERDQQKWNPVLPDKRLRLFRDRALILKKRMILSPNRSHPRVKPEGMLWRIVRIFINSKPQRRLLRRGESPLSGAAAF
jgi:hypothetical protein